MYIGPSLQGHKESGKYVHYNILVSIAHKSLHNVSAIECVGWLWRDILCFRFSWESRGCRDGGKKAK